MQEHNFTFTFYVIAEICNKCTTLKGDVQRRQRIRWRGESLSVSVPYCFYHAAVNNMLGDANNNTEFEVDMKKTKRMTVVCDGSKSESKINKGQY